MNGQWIVRVVAGVSLVLGGGLAGGCAGDSTSQDDLQMETDQLPKGSGPCDIYAYGNTPCLAAHSTVRALFRTYSGPLYQVEHDDDHETRDIHPLAPGGVANAGAQDSFCRGHGCRITKIYDQSPNGNHLAPPEYTTFSSLKHKKFVGAVADEAPVHVSGHKAYGVAGTSGAWVGYRNVPGSPGAVKGNAAESMYAVFDGKRSSDRCCFDYGNSEVSGNDDGEGTMEALYFGRDTSYGGHGEGNGPWIAADLEQGMYKCDKGGPDADCRRWAPSLTSDFVTAVLDGPAAVGTDYFASDYGKFALRAGDSQRGQLKEHWNGKRPAHRPLDTKKKPAGPPGPDGKPTMITQEYSPKHLQGAIVLGTGGDGSFWGTGTFFEGAMTDGVPSPSIEQRVQSNIVAARYRR